MIKLIEAKSSKEYKIAINLFKEYAAQIGVDLSFQNFRQEILNIESQYGTPSGIIYLALDSKENPVGCFGIRPFENSVCELKRMY